MPTDSRIKTADARFARCVSLQVGVSGLLQYLFGGQRRDNVTNEQADRKN